MSNDLLCGGNSFLVARMDRVCLTAPGAPTRPTRHGAGNGMSGGQKARACDLGATTLSTAGGNNWRQGSSPECGNVTPRKVEALRERLVRATHCHPQQSDQARANGYEREDLVAHKTEERNGGAARIISAI